ncbi:chloride channel protein [Chitinophaga sp. GCM10012297]|uniref:Chloride channel protein n=1 Tax=Chitinophaga chungangae TaxID=2821488 RepID=A0ABS3YJF5_9BACT|nr:chloride channel protein [Chitinophaga chungangae]MBO9154814.1 chloride channel protein [Chitinophaga chungangae]
MEGAGNKYYRLLIRFGNYRTRFTSHRNFLIILSFVVGVVAALAAVLLKLTVQFFEHRVEAMNNFMSSNWLSAVLPLIGTGLSLLLLTRFFRNRLNRGVGFIIHNIVSNKGRIEKRHTYGHIITSAITVAFGGSVGLEAPIVATGAAIGSNTGHDLRLSPKDTVLLLACGTASGLAAVFNSPFAGIIFVLEIFLLDFSIPFFIPLLISTATATVVSQVLYPGKFIFTASESWSIEAIPFYILLGICCGMISVYITRSVDFIEGYFEKKRMNWKTWLVAGIPLCLLIFLLPGLYGEGYSVITSLLEGRYTSVTAHSFLQGYSAQAWAIVLMTVLMLVFKVICSCLTISAGGNGGIFAPSMITGGLTGFLFAYLVNLSGFYQLNTPNFIIAAMAGVVAGVMHAPLTAIFLLAEISGGYKLFIPLMIVSAISYFITRKYEKHSVYHKSLVERKILTDENIHDHF